MGAGWAATEDCRITVLQDRIEQLLNDISEETTRRKRAEAQAFTLQNDLQGLRDFYAGFESPSQDKSQETRDREADEKVVYVLHLEAMVALKAEHIRHASQIESDFVEILAESDEKYQRFLEEMQAQGFWPCGPGVITSGAQAPSSERFAQLKDFLKRRLCDKTKELVTQNLAGVTFPASYGGGDAVDQVSLIWAGILLQYMTPADGVVSQKGREVLTAIVSAIPSGLALDEAYEQQLSEWRESEEGLELIDGFNEIDEGEIRMLDIRHVLSGKYNSPDEDLFRFLYGTVNAAELCLNRNVVKSTLTENWTRFP